jgi:hypothetical protein
MNAIERFLYTDPRDAGCAETVRALPVYVEAQLAGEKEPDAGVAAHLRACSPCEEDRRGLLAACVS